MGISWKTENLLSQKKLRQNGTIPGFSSSFIKKILDNPVYMGKIAYGRRRTKKKTGTRNETHIVEQAEFPVYEGIHVAIISEVDWNLAQEKRSKNNYKREKIRDPEHAHILSGILKCPCCGKGMYGNIAKVSRKNNKTRYYYYCKNTVNATGHKCTFRSNIEQPQIDDVLAKLITAMTKEGKFKDAIQDRIGATVDTSDLEKQLTALNANLHQAETIKTRLDNAGNLENAGNLNNGGTLDNSGTLDNDGNLNNDGTLDNSGALTNGKNATIENGKDGNITNKDGASLDNSGSLENEGNISNDKDSTIKNNPGASISGDGDVANNGNIANNGTISAPVENGEGAKVDSEVTWTDSTGKKYSGSLEEAATYAKSHPDEKITVTLNKDVNVDKEIEIPNGVTLEIPKGITLNVKEDGSLKIDENANVNINGGFNNEGSVTSDGTITNNGSMNNSGSLESTGDINNNGSVSNSGSLDNAGNINNNGNVSNSGSLDNSGTVTNAKDATIENSKDGTLTNKDSAKLDNAGTLDNSGLLDSTGSITNIGSVSNTGSLDNNGSITNSGSVSNTGSLDNTGSITNIGNINNTGSLDNSGTVDNSTSGSITNANDATVTNNLGANISNSGSIDNSGKIVNSGDVSNTGTLNNGSTAYITGKGNVENNGVIDNSGSITIKGELTGNSSITGDGDVKDKISTVVVTKENDTSIEETVDVSLGDGTVTVIVDSLDKDGKSAGEVISNIKIASAYELIKSAVGDGGIVEIEQGDEIMLKLAVVKIAENVDKNAGQTIEEFAQEKSTDKVKLVVGEYVDISLKLKQNKLEWQYISQLNEEVEITIQIPENLKGKSVYYIIRNHDGVCDMLEDLDDNPDTITFRTDRFSTYAIAYDEEVVAHASPTIHRAPKTSDNALSDMYMYMMLVMLGMTAVIVSARRKRAQM